MPLMLVVAVLTCGSGCAKPDWIQQTLVTVDVTGTWETIGGPPFMLVVEQQGPKVSGFFKTSGFNQIGLWRPVDGIVVGDVFSFKLRDGESMGPMTVSGDEMTGKVESTIPGGGRRPAQYTLHRINWS